MTDPADSPAPLPDPEVGFPLDFPPRVGRGVRPSRRSVGRQRRFIRASARLGSADQAALAAEVRRAWEQRARPDFEACAKREAAGAAAAPDGGGGAAAKEGEEK